MKVSKLPETQQAQLAELQAELLEVQTQLARRRAELELIEARAEHARVKEELSQEQAESARSKKLLGKVITEKSQLQVDYDKSLKTNASLVQRIFIYTRTVRELSAQLKHSTERLTAHESSADSSRKPERAANHPTIFSGKKHRIETDQYDPAPPEIKRPRR